MQPSIAELIVYPLELNRIDIFSYTSTNISFFFFLLYSLATTDFSIAFEDFVFLLKIFSLSGNLLGFTAAIGSLTINGFIFSVVVICGCP